MNILQFFRDWSEVWALLIPLIVILVYKPRGYNMRWLILYVVAAFVLNIFAVIIVEYDYLLPIWLNYGNNIFYNLHSFIMVISFSVYIINVRKYKYKHLLKTMLILYLAFVLLNFVFWESLLLLSTHHFTGGSIVLLLMCLLYFLSAIQEESPTIWLKHASFIICAAVALYQAITFFIFLFIYPMNDRAFNSDGSFALIMMRIYQAIFVVFCILLAIAFYRSRKIRAG